MGAADSNKGLDRPYYQGMVVATAAFSGFSNAQAPGMAGYVIPQITNGKDSIYVDRGTASWVALAHYGLVYKVQKLDAKSLF